MSPRSVRSLLALALVACGGGSSSPVTPNPPAPPAGSTNFSATIDGTDWSSLAAASTAIGSPNGSFSLAGGSTSGTGMALAFFNIPGPGTYPFGVGPTAVGGVASIAHGGASWSTPLSGAAGTVTFTTVSATRLAGTFSYAAPATTGGSTGSRTVTNGRFDLPVTSAGNVAVAANAGNRFQGSINGTAWNAATIVMTSRPPTGTLSVTVNNTSYQLQLSLAGFTGTGSYPLGASPQRMMLATQLGPNTNWGGPGSASTGTIVVTSSTASRVVGTYDLSLPPSTLNPGSGTLRVVGSFDLGIP